jgi:hypothetical protein
VAPAGWTAPITILHALGQAQGKTRIETMHCLKAPPRYHYHQLLLQPGPDTSQPVLLLGSFRQPERMSDFNDRRAEVFFKGRSYLFELQLRGLVGNQGLLVGALIWLQQVPDSFF